MMRSDVPAVVAPAASLLRTGRHAQGSALRAAVSPVVPQSAELLMAGRARLRWCDQPFRQLHPRAASL